MKAGSTIFFLLLCAPPKKMYLNQTLVNILTLVTGLVLRDLIMETVGVIRNKPGSRLARGVVTLIVAMACILVLVYAVE